VGPGSRHGKHRGRTIVVDETARRHRDDDSSLPASRRRGSRSRRSRDIFAAMEDERVADLRARPWTMILILAAAGGIAITVGAFLVYDHVTAAPSPSEVCAGFASRIGAAHGEEGKVLFRATYPSSSAPPAPNGLVTLIGDDPVEDTTANLCRHNLYVWEHHLRRDPYVALVKCVADADLAGLPACYQAARRADRK
jgi:hypothetical protein